MHADTATRQHWMSVLAHSQPAELAARLKALNITGIIYSRETQGVQIQFTRYSQAFEYCLRLSV